MDSPFRNENLPVSQSPESPELTNHLNIDDVPHAVKKALSSMLSALPHHDIASTDECDSIAETVKSQWTQGKGADPIEALARLRSSDDKEIDATVEELSLRVAQIMPAIPLRIPFAGRLITPTSFYEKFSNITKWCQLMMVPVTFNEDADVIGLTSINPYFSGALSGMIIEELKNYTHVIPLISITRMDYITWKALNEKHFRKVGAYD